MLEACLCEVIRTFFTTGVAGALAVAFPVGLTVIDVLALDFEGEVGTSCFRGSAGAL